MQLFALLESLDKYVDNLQKITVLCRVSPSFEKGYGIVRQNFPSVYFVQQSNTTPKADFKHHLIELLFGDFGKNSDYILFAVDDILVTEPFDVLEGVKKLQETGAYGFYYRLGKNIQYCHMLQQNQKIPSLTDVGDGCFAWKIHTAEMDWGYPNTVDLTLYAKKDIQEAVMAASFTGPNEFEGHWGAIERQRNGHKKIGLCYEHSKMVNLDINAVSEYREERRSDCSPESLNQLFMKGKKIDIEPFHFIQNKSPHIKAGLSFKTFSLKPQIISVAVPCHYTHFSYLAGLLDALVSQTRLPDEVIISLSMADRVPIEELKKFESTVYPFPVRLLKDTDRLSPGANRNRACEACRGDIIITQDADDLPHKQRIQIIGSCFSSCLVAHLIHQWSPGENYPFRFMPDFPLSLEKYDVEKIHAHQIASWDEAFKHAYLHFGNTAIHRTVFEKTGWEPLFLGEDLRFGEKALTIFHATYILELPLVCYRPELSAINPEASPNCTLFTPSESQTCHQ